MPCVSIYNFDFGDYLCSHGRVWDWVLGVANALGGFGFGFGSGPSRPRFWFFRVHCFEVVISALTKLRGNSGNPFPTFYFKCKS